MWRTLACQRARRGGGRRWSPGWIRIVGARLGPRRANLLAGLLLVAGLLTLTLDVLVA
jgi:hypothetical protein